MGIVRNTPESTKGEVNDNALFLYAEHHSREMSRKKHKLLLAKSWFKGMNGSICNIYNDNGATMNINKPIIDYSRGKNIRDTLISSKFQSRSKLLSNAQDDTY